MKMRKLELKAEAKRAHGNDLNRPGFAGDARQFGLEPDFKPVEDLLAGRGIDASYETVRRWVLKFGAVDAKQVCLRQPRPSARWHFEEFLVHIDGQIHYLWRAVDDEGEMLDLIVRPRRDRHAAIELLRQTPEATGLRAGCRGHGPASILRHRSPLFDMGAWPTAMSPTGGPNKQAEVSHQPTR